MEAYVDHISVLVPSVAGALNADFLQTFPVGEVCEYVSEGTREVYLGHSGAAGKILLVEAIGPGPYLDAMEKRGTGLHHIGVVVASIRAFLSSVVKSGWLLHLKSLETLSKQSTVWLARPGMPFMVEVMEVQNYSAPTSSLVQSLVFPPKVELRCVEGLQLDILKMGSVDQIELRFSGLSMPLQKFYQ